MKHYTLSQFPEDNNQLSFLLPSIQRTFELIDGYVDRWTIAKELWGDLPYNLNERATLSVFSGGVWRSNTRNFVIEEFAGEKDHGDGVYRGRHDLWIYADDFSCSLEAKQVWPNLDGFSPEAARTRIVDVLTGEAKVAGAPNSNDETICAGLLFAVPHIFESRFTEGADLIKEYKRFLAGALQELAGAGEYSVVWGHYHRPELLEARAYYQSTTEGVLTRPGVDIVLATRALRFAD